MEIALDCRMIASSGIGVFLRETLPFMLRTQNQFILLGSERLIRENLPETDLLRGTQIIQCDTPIFSPKELLFFPKGIAAQINSCGAYYTPYFNIPARIRIPVYITIHDIIFPDIPELTSKAGLMARMFFYKHAYKKARAVFTVSEFSKERIQFHLGKNKHIIVVHNGIASYLAQETPQQKTEKRIVFIGNIKKHKGLQVLLPAFAELRKKIPDVVLTIIGSSERFRSADSETASQIRNAQSLGIDFTGAIENSKLKNILASSALLVQPSLYEGFGIPPLEAMYCGTPAIVSDIPVFKEIYGKFPVIFFKSGNTEDLADKLTAFFTDVYPKRITLTEQQKNTYSYRTTADTIIRTIKQSGKE